MSQTYTHSCDKVYCDCPQSMWQPVVPTTTAAPFPISYPTHEYPYPYPTHEMPGTYIPGTKTFTTVLTSVDFEVLAKELQQLRREVESLRREVRILRKTR